jgi:hypothetical protein
MSACFDEGTLQAYADGELDAVRAGEVSAHLAACATCAAVINEASENFALLSSALDAGETLSIPTERLRARIDAAIAELQPTRIAQPYRSPSFVERLRDFASSLAFVPRQATGFVSLVVAAVLLASIFYLFRPQARTTQQGQNVTNEIAKVNQPTSAGASTTGQNVTRQNGANGAGTSGETIGQESNNKQESNGGKPGVGRAATNSVGRTFGGSSQFVNGSYRTASGAGGGAARSNVDNVSNAALLPVEKPYAVAAASLKSSIDQQGTRVMTPTLRAEYERNLAVVDRAIAASRVAARRDPSDRDAQEFLRSAYQDKLELLRAVADQTQLASVTR